LLFEIADFPPQFIGRQPLIGDETRSKCSGQDHGIWQLGFKFSNGSDNHFDIFTRGTIIGAQIITRFLGFDPVQYQRPAALRARRPKIVDELKIRTVHGTA